MKVITLAALLAVSAFSAFPSPFYSDIASGSSWGLWASAILFSGHGIAAIAAMSLLRAMSRRLTATHIVVAALALDAIGGLVLVLGMESSSVTTLLAGRITTGLALGLVTPVLTEHLSHARHGIAQATAGTLGGVGLGALSAGLLAYGGFSVGAVFGIGSAVVAGLGLLYFITAPSTNSLAPTSPSAAPRGDGLSAPWIALATIFVANGVLGLLTSLVPAVMIDHLNGGALLAGVLVAGAMIGAGAVKLLLAAVRIERTALVAAATVIASALALGLGSVAESSSVVLIGFILMGAACGLGYNAGLHMAIGSKVDSLVRLRAMAEAQRAGQLGLVIPALLFPALRLT